MYKNAVKFLLVVTLTLPLVGCIQSSTSEVPQEVYSAENDMSRFGETESMYGHEYIKVDTCKGAVRYCWYHSDFCTACDQQ